MFAINNIYWNIAIVPFNSPALMMPDGSLAYGMCDNYTNTIYLSDELYGEFFKKVLCHEITHAAMFSYDVSLDYDEEELVADIIAAFGGEIVDITNRVFYTIKKRFAA